MAIVVLNRWIVTQGPKKKEFIHFTKDIADTTGSLTSNLQKPEYVSVCGVNGVFKAAATRNVASLSGRTISLSSLNALTQDMLCEVWGV
jgi:hypothetical protein